MQRKKKLKPKLKSGIQNNIFIDSTLQSHPFGDKKNIIDDVKEYMNDSIFTRKQRLRSAGRIRKDCNTAKSGATLDWFGYNKEFFFETPLGGTQNITVNESGTVSKRTNERFDGNHVVTKIRQRPRSSYIPNLENPLKTNNRISMQRKMV